MFKKLNKITLLTGFMIFILSNIFLIAEGWSIWNFLSRTYTELVDDDYVWSIAWKAVVSDLYYKSLEISRTNEIASVQKAIKESLSFVKNSSQLLCNISENDIINILYYSNDSFKRSFKQNILNFDPKAKLSYPSTDQYLMSCGIFMNCVYWDLQVEDKSLLSKSCSQKLNQIYLDVYSSDSQISSFDQVNYWDDLFWNAKLDDADYDIIYDIGIIWKLLFYSFKSAPQVLYYQFPDIWYWDEDNETNTPDNYIIDWYSAYDPWDFSSWDNSNYESWSNNLYSGSNNNFWNQSNSSSIIDNEILNLIENSNTPVYYENQYEENLINWNVCISWSFLSWETVVYYNTWEFISWYLNILKDQIKQNQDLWNFFMSWEQINLTWNSALNQIEEQVELLSDINNPESQSAILSCIDKCDWLAVDDKMLCIVKCTCSEFSSPAVSNWFFDILDEWVFKIRFCMIPVQDRQFSQNWKMVFSIEEIYDELYSILSSLRNWWELLVNKKTKEFLESSVTKNKFWKIFSFNVSSSFKNIFSQSSEKTESKNEEKFEDDVSKSILSYWDNLDSAQERNKYNLLWDPDGIIKELQISNNLSSFPSKWLNPIWDPSKIIQTDRLMKMNQLVLAFLDTNLMFWEDVLDIMESIDSVAENMSRK